MSKHLLLAFTAIFVTGCATTNPISTPPYYPSNPSAVLLTHKGEVQTSGSVSTGGETFLAAYALTPHIGLLADGSLVLHKSGDPNGNQYSGDLGIGYFDTGVARHFISEIYSAIGWGSAQDHLVSDYPGNTFDDFLEMVKNNENVHFWNAWMQGATGYARENFSFMLLTRFSYVNIYHDSNQESVSGLFETPSHYDTTIVHSSYLLLLSPGLEMRYGFEHIQLIASVFELLASGSYDPRLLSSLGISYKF
jgi:hypothetical protein